MNSWRTWFSDRLEFGALLDDETWRQLPASRGLMLLADESERPIQLLPAADMRQRLRNRLQQPESQELTRRINLREIVRYVWWVRLGSRFETDWLYLQLASELWPKRFAKMVSWKSPWFVYLDLQAAYPHFSRTREPGRSQGHYLGPFPSGRDADKFIASLQEAFYLCRSVHCLRRSPNGPKCAYAQMGTCVSPGDGTISMDDYREILKKALAAGEGRRGEVIAQWTRAMQQASKKLEFEKAAAWKKRLGYLANLDTDAFSQVRPLNQFSFLMIQPGVGRRQYRLFGIHRGKLERLGVLDWPLDSEKLAGIFSKALFADETSNSIDMLGRLRMGLVCRELFSESKRRGLILHFSAESIQTPDEVLSVIAQWEEKNQTPKEADAEENEIEPPST